MKIKDLLTEAADYSTKSRAIKTVVAAGEKTGGKPRHSWAYNNGEFTHYIGNKVHKKVKIAEGQHWDKNPPKNDAEKGRFHADQASLATNSVTKNHHKKLAKKYMALTKSSNVAEAAPEWIAAKHGTKGVMVKNPNWTPSFKAPKVASGLNRSEAMKARHAAYRAKISKLHMAIVNAIGNSFPDGDPYDTVYPYAKRLFGIDEWGDASKYITAAVKMEDPKYKDLSDWMATLWDDYSADSIYDAKNGHVENNNPFYRVGENGEIEPEANPWR
jgi:hypothetical protein